MSTTFWAHWSYFDKVAAALRDQCHRSMCYALEATLDVNSHLHRNHALSIDNIYYICSSWSIALEAPSFANHRLSRLETSVTLGAEFKLIFKIDREDESLIIAMIDDKDVSPFAQVVANEVAQVINRAQKRELKVTVSPKAPTNHQVIIFDSRTPW